VENGGGVGGGGRGWEVRGVEELKEKLTTRG
jgi:hypothetical protein